MILTQFAVSPAGFGTVLRYGVRQAVEPAQRMEITWIGGSCFRFRGRDGALVTDPQTSGRVRRSTFPKADLVAITNPDVPPGAERLVLPNHASRDPYVAASPGEYDMSGVYLHGIAGPRAPSGRPGQTVYALDIDRLTVALIPSLAGEMTNEMLEELGTAQVLVVSADDGVERVVSLVNRIEPNIVIPFGRSSNGRNSWLGAAKALSEAEPTPETSVSVSLSNLPEPVVTRVLAQRVA
jgi:hypothetical protein